MGWSAVLEPEIREDFGSVEQLLQRALVYSRELRDFNHSDWSHLRNREDFNAVYRLPVSQRRRLERLYQNGRDLAVELSYLLCAFNDVGEYPTFKSFVDTVEAYVSSEPPKLETTLAEAEAILPDLEHPLWAIERMIELARRQLAMVAAMNEWLRAAREAPLYRQEAGLSVATAPAPEGRASGMLIKIGRLVIVPIVVSVIAGLVLASIASIL